MSKSKITLLLIFISFLLSCILSVNNIYKFDKNIKNIHKDTYYHQMIKFDTFRFMDEGDKIKNQIKNGISFSATGDESLTKYLPSRIFALYYYFFNLDLYSDKEKNIINTEIHLPYLLIQTFVYYLSLLILYNSIKNKFSYRICLITIAFLSLEPTIFQYHSTFWSETYFFSLQIILFSLILKKEKTLLLFLIGFITSFLALQKELAYLYIVIIIIYYLIFSKNKTKTISCIFLSFILIQLIVGYNNYKRSGKFYILPATTKFDLHLTIVKDVVTKKENITTKEFFLNEGFLSLNYLKNNSKNFKNNEKNDENYDLWEHRNNILNEKDRVIFDEFIFKRTIYFFLKYPVDFISHIFIRSAHTALLNPFHIYSEHKYRSPEIYYKSKEHKNLIPLRIIYSIIIYLIILIGLKVSFKKNLKINTYLYLSIFYFFFTISWHGNTRYILPSLIYLSIFFAFGLDKVLEYYKNLKK
jgi:hypothetical protein